MFAEIAFDTAAEAAAGVPAVEAADSAAVELVVEFVVHFAVHFVVELVVQANAPEEDRQALAAAMEIAALAALVAQKPKKLNRELKI